MLFLPGLAAPNLVVSSWADFDREWLLTPADTVKAFVAAIEGGDHLYGVNLAYDLGVLAAYDPSVLPWIFEAGNAGQLHDCAIREALHDIARDCLFSDPETGRDFSHGSEMGGRYSMALLFKRYFGVDLSDSKTNPDSWRFKYAALDGVPLEQWPSDARLYAEQDARRTLDIARAQRGHKNLHDEPAQVRASIAIQLMRVWGFRTDGAYLANLEQRVDAEWTRARAEFSKAGIFRPDGTKDKKHLQALVSAAYDHNPPKSPKGGISTDRDTLEESGVEILIQLGQSGKNDKRKTTNIPALKAGVHVPINPEFNVIVNTGRVSSDAQQWPQKGGIREAVIARPGTVILSCDYGGLELRTMSQRAIFDPDVGFSRMAEFINSGKDPHAHVAATFIGSTYEDAIARVKAKDPIIKVYRDCGKVWNFGKGGGMGPKAMVYNARAKDNIRFCLLVGGAKSCGIRKEEAIVQGKRKRICSHCVEIAKRFDALWLRAWPEQGLLFQKAGKLTASNAKVDSVTFGSLRVRGRCGYTQWLNNPFQGAGGDGTKAAMWNLAEKMYTDRRSALWGCRTFLNVHDELLVEVPDEPQRRHDASFEIARLMVETMDRVTPDVKNEVTPAIMRRLFKAASDVYDSKKLLRPWWPEDAGQLWLWAPDRVAMEHDRAA